MSNLILIIAGCILFFALVVAWLIIETNRMNGGKGVGFRD